MTCICKICGLEKDYPQDYEKWPSILTNKPAMYPVCKNGNPDNKTSRFICARCLSQANKMKGYIKTIVSGLIITDHAAQRFIERSTFGVENVAKARKTILKIFNKASKANSIEKSKFIMEIDSKYADADFYIFQHTIFVVSDGHPNKKLLTIFRIKSKKGAMYKIYK